MLSIARRKNKSNELVCAFIDYLKETAEKYKSFLSERSANYNVSSDVIESLFGKQKSMMSSNSLVGVTIQDLQLAVQTTPRKEIINILRPALEAVLITTLCKWKQEHSYGNQALKRSEFFKK